MKVFFSRGMDGLNSDTIVAREIELREALTLLRMSILNPYKPNDERRNRISGVTEIIEEDLSLLEHSDIVLIDLSVPRRSYIGAIVEMTRAYDLGKEIYVWVGNSENEKRTWLKYHASAICKTFDDVIELLEVTFTNEGRERNRKETIAYYSNVASEYEAEHEVDAMNGRFRYIARDVNSLKPYWREWEAIQKWVSGVTTEGTVVELGSGTGQWVSTWAKNAKRVVCVDASSEMLSISKSQNRFSNVEHIKGDILDALWLKRYLREIEEIDVIVLAFVLGTLTLEQEGQCLAILREAVSPGSSLVLCENQSSIFSDPVFYSRMNIQQRWSLDGANTFRIYKRNFLSQDIYRLLNRWGKTTDFFYTENYFIAGIAKRI